jgi:4-hydroxy-2-oxoheptanedioate aldolase
MIETPRGLSNLEAICAVPGLDGVFVGPSDLSLALGVAPVPDWKAQPLAGALARIVEAAHAAGRLAGIFCISTAFAADMKRMGFDFVVHSNDAAILREAAQRAVAGLKSAPGRDATG